MLVQMYMANKYLTNKYSTLVVNRQQSLPGKFWDHYFLWKQQGLWWSCNENHMEILRNEPVQKLYPGNSCEQI